MTTEKKDNSTKNHIVDAENLEVDYNFHIMHYYLDENGHYTHQLKANWGGKELTNTQSWEIVKERIRRAKEKVINGEVSPIAYYMEKCLTDVKTLALYIGFSKWKVKRHLSIKKFKKLDEKTLKKYANFFEISIEELKDIDHIKL